MQFPASGDLKAALKDCCAFLAVLEALEDGLNRGNPGNPHGAGCLEFSMVFPARSGGMNLMFGLCWNMLDN